MGLICLVQVQVKAKGWGGLVGGSRFKSQWGQKFTYQKKKSCFVLNNVSFVLANLPLTFVVFPYRVTLLGDFA